MFFCSRAASEEDLAASGINECAEIESRQMEDDPDYVYTPPFQKRPETVTLTLPTKGLFTGTAAITTRRRMSHRDTTGIMGHVIKLGGASLKPFVISKSSSDRHRKKEVESLAMKIKKDFIADIPEHVILHWDSKVIQYVDHHTDDRLAVVVSSPSDGTKPMFIASPLIPDSTGLSQKQALVNVVLDWNIPKENIVGLCWDTTASNTGAYKGSATLFERYTGHACFWIGCRYHIGERHIHHADKMQRGAKEGPTDPLFIKFRKLWKKNEITGANPQYVWQWPDSTRPHTIVYAKACEALEFYTQALQKDTWTRGDYRELAELGAHYLGGQVSSKD